MSKDLNIIRQWESGDKEEFKRPDHPDFMTSMELKLGRWSGIRSNSISRMREIWILGDKKAEMAEETIHFRPDEWNKLYAEVFGLHHVETVERKGN